VNVGDSNSNNLITPIHSYIINTAEDKGDLMEDVKLPVIAPGDEIGVNMLNGTRQSLYLEDGPYAPEKEGDRVWLSASDDDGEIKSVEWDSKWGGYYEVK
jgi:hypothetical protein